MISAQPRVLLPAGRRGSAPPSVRSRWRAGRLLRRHRPARPAAAAAALSLDAPPPPQRSSLQLALSDGTLRLLYASLALYGACYSLAAPVLPALVASISSVTSPALEFGRLLSFYCALQLVGGLLAGPLCDAAGPRVGMLLSFTMGCVAFGIVASSTSLGGLYLSRIPCALVHASMAARVAVAARATTPSQAAGLLGYTARHFANFSLICFPYSINFAPSAQGLAYSVGAIVGPLLGGYIGANFGLRAAFAASSAGFALAATAVWLFLPPDAPPPPPPLIDTDHAQLESSKKKKPGPADLLRVASFPGVPRLLVAKTVMSAANTLVFGVLPLAAVSQFALSPAAVGGLLSWVACVAMVTQGLVVEPLVARTTPHFRFGCTHIVFLPTFQLPPPPPLHFYPPDSCCAPPASPPPTPRWAPSRWRTQ